METGYREKPQELTDLRKAECPYCRGPLKKVPAAKTKCPHCAEFMFVRTRIKDGARVVVTREEAYRIDEDWQIVTGAREPNVDQFVSKEEFDAEQDRIEQAFLSRGYPEPSQDDVKWSLLNKIAIQHASEGNWGLSRNTYLMMAEFLTRRWKLKDALKFYLYVCVLDLNGAQNRAGMSSEIAREFPVFDLTMSALAPVVVEQVRAIGERLKLSSEDLRALFLERASAAHFPVSNEKGWSVFLLALGKEIDFDDQPNCFNKIRSLLVN